ncbi:MAG: hypothetical protein ACEY3J_04610 [Arsenophonus sp.]
MKDLLFKSQSILRIDLAYSVMLFFALISLFYLGAITEELAHETLRTLHWKILILDEVIWGLTN